MNVDCAAKKPLFDSFAAFPASSVYRDLQGAFQQKVFAAGMLSRNPAFAKLRHHKTLASIARSMGMPPKPGSGESSG